MRAFLRGLVAGLVLSAVRLPLGTDLCTWGATSARASYGWRTAALVAVALGLASRAGTVLGPALLGGACVGFGLHGLLLANAWSPGGARALAATAAVGAVLLAAIRPARDPGERVEPAPKLVEPKFFEMVGLAAASAGAAIAVEAIARSVRLYGSGLAQDDTVTALVLLGLLFVGAWALGWIGSRPALRGIASPAALAACACLCLVSLHVISRIDTAPELGAFLKRFRLDASSHGTIGYDALIAGALLGAPALLLGAALPAIRGSSRAFSLLVGAALGIALVPGLLAVDPTATLTEAQPSSADLIPLGNLIASAGAFLAILSLDDRGALARWIGIAACVAIALPCLLRTAEPVAVLSPWARRPLFPSFVSDTPEGLITVESFGILGGSWLWATLDRRELTPELDGAVADALRLRSSLDVIPVERRIPGKIRVLLVGQLTPERSRILKDAGVGRLDRTGAWWHSMRRVEETMWSALAERLPNPPGEILEPREARKRIDRGDYDLVIAAPVPGDAPRPAALDVADDTTVVRWIGLDEPLAQRRLDESAVLLLDGLERPALALVENGGAAGDDPFAPLPIRTGEPRRAPTPLAWLGTHESEVVHERSYAARRTMMARLAEAERGGRLEDLTSGFSIYSDAQVSSTKPESAADQVELPDECLERFRKAALAGPPDPTLHRTWETIARLLVGKSWFPKVYDYVGPVAERHKPWPALEKALARADLESSQAERAQKRLEALKGDAADDFELWFLLGKAQCATGDKAEVLESWKRAAKLKTSDKASRRVVAMALARAGIDEGREAARQLLKESPNDTELRALMDQPDVPGPAPDPCAP